MDEHICLADGVIYLYKVSNQNVQSFTVFKLWRSGKKHLEIHEGA